MSCSVPFAPALSEADSEWKRLHQERQRQPEAAQEQQPHPGQRHEAVAPTHPPSTGADEAPSSASALTAVAAPGEAVSPHGSVTHEAVLQAAAPKEASVVADAATVPFEAAAPVAVKAAAAEPATEAAAARAPDASEAAAQAPDVPAVQPESQVSLLKLPDHVLLNIFSHVPLQDRSVSSYV